MDPINHGAWENYAPQFTKQISKPCRKLKFAMYTLILSLLEENIYNFILKQFLAAKVDPSIAPACYHSVQTSQHIVIILFCHLQILVS